jgi:hypothetical protein
MGGGRCSGLGDTLFIRYNGCIIVMVRLMGWIGMIRYALVVFLCLGLMDKIIYMLRLCLVCDCE